MYTCNLHYVLIYIMGVITVSPLFYVYRIVYRWFLLIYQASYALGIIGYIILLVVFTGLGLLLPFNPDTILEFGITLVFYGVYYGVMGRDCAEVCVDYMAASMTVSNVFNVLNYKVLLSEMV